MIKKILTLNIFLLALLFTACEPMEDIYKEIDDNAKDYVVANVEYTLSDADYATMGGDVAKYGNFSESVPAADYVPAFLASKYKALGLASRATVTYNFYKTYTDYYSTEFICDYTLRKGDYEDMGGDVEKYHNFSSNAPAADYLPAFLAAKYADASEGDVKSIRYYYYAGGGNSEYRLDDYRLNSGVWAEVGADYILTNADYEAMETDPNHSVHKYHNFSSSYPASDYLPAFLLTQFPAAVSGDTKMIQYTYYNGSTSNKIDEYAFDGTVWAATGGTLEVKDALENPADVAQELLKADYEAIGGDVGKYLNFSSSAKPGDYLPPFLKVKYPYAINGTRKVIRYAYYSSSSPIRTSEFTFDGTNWVMTVNETVAMTEEYVHKGTAWEVAPEIGFVETTDAHTREYTLTNADFELVGNGKYHNFDVRDGKPDADIAVRIAKITTILKTNFVDIEAGDVFLVKYAAYGGPSDPMEITLKAVELSK